ncbi:hypothetical protein EV210_11187 [Anaerospora hongkongensis]|uniref:rRNA biogenesis protein rrp5 n=1 Tax=Anaerospora hongkongensis TaxID=244830 RepID=A0A4R1PUI0_9FIRM|nr:hypothetical protein [Anaerospora hongkongensis]TCL35621.1 hypothetical protein EV210_11187 [Anaerospora hongkongensis]
MHITIDVNIKGLDFLTALLGQVKTVEETKKTVSPRGNKSAAQKAPEPEPAAEDPTENPSAPVEEVDELAKIPTIEELKAAAVEKGKTPESKAAIKKLLASFESTSISAIPEGKRAAFLASLEDL